MRAPLIELDPRPVLGALNFRRGLLRDIDGVLHPSGTASGITAVVAIDLRRRLEVLQRVDQGGAVAQ